MWSKVKTVRETNGDRQRVRTEKCAAVFCLTPADSRQERNVFLHDQGLHEYKHPYQNTARPVLEFCGETNRTTVYPAGAKTLSTLSLSENCTSKLRLLKP